MSNQDDLLVGYRNKILALTIWLAGGLCALATCLLLLIAVLLPFVSVMKVTVSKKVSEFLIFSTGTLWISTINKILCTTLAEKSSQIHIFIDLFGLVVNIIISYALIFSSGLGFIGCCVSFVLCNFLVLAARIICYRYLYDEGKNELEL